MKQRQHGEANRLMDRMTIRPHPVLTLREMEESHRLPDAEPQSDRVKRNKLLAKRPKVKDQIDVGFQKRHEIVVDASPLFCRYFLLQV